MKVFAPAVAEAGSWRRVDTGSSLSQDYGGYLSTYILPAKGENQGQTFTCGSALAPITDFKLYGNGLDRTWPLRMALPQPLCAPATGTLSPHHTTRSGRVEAFPLNGSAQAPNSCSHAPGTQDQESELVAAPRSAVRTASPRAEGQEASGIPGAALLLAASVQASGVSGVCAP